MTYFSKSLHEIPWHFPDIGPFAEFPWHFFKFPDNSLTLKKLIFPWLFPDVWQPCIFTPDNIWWGGDYIVTLYFHPWQYSVRGWLYRDIIFSTLTIFIQGGGGGGGCWWLYRDIIFSLLTIFGEGVIISWHIFTPEDIWWGSDYIVTLQYNFWHYPRIWHWRWLYFNIFTIQIWLCSDTRVFYHSYPYIHPMKLEGLKWLYLSMIPSLLLKLSVLVDMLMDCINSLWWTKICKKS